MFKAAAAQNYCVRGVAKKTGIRGVDIPDCAVFQKQLAVPQVQGQRSLLKNCISDLNAGTSYIRVKKLGELFRQMYRCAAIPTIREDSAPELHIPAQNGNDMAAHG